MNLEHNFFHGAGIFLCNCAQQALLTSEGSSAELDFQKVYYRQERLKQYSDDPVQTDAKNRNHAYPKCYIVKPYRSCQR